MPGQILVAAGAELTAYRFLDSEGLFPVLVKILEKDVATNLAACRAKFWSRLLPNYHDEFGCVAKNGIN